MATKKSLVVISGFLFSLMFLPTALGGPQEGTRGGSLAEGLVFASGEIVAVQHESQAFRVRIYFDREGNYDRHEIALTYGPQTLFTDGEQDLDRMALQKDREVDVEYDPRTRMATYVFVYT